MVNKQASKAALVPFDALFCVLSSQLQPQDTAAVRRRAIIIVMTFDLFRSGTRKIRENTTGKIAVYSLTRHETTLPSI